MPLRSTRTRCEERLTMLTKCECCGFFVRFVACKSHVQLPLKLFHFTSHSKLVKRVIRSVGNFFFEMSNSGGQGSERGSQQ